MQTTVFLQAVFRWLLVLSALGVVLGLLYKDRLPEADFYDPALLETEPVQAPTDRKPFETEVSGHAYEIIPRYQYELHGVVVSYHNADALDDIWHHRRWKDFINLRDICVVWGKNLSSRFYLDAEFENDSWTCWAFWPDRETGSRLSKTQLSNNHLLTDDPYLSERIMEAEIGDHIYFEGVLADYRNRDLRGGFRRTSTTRTDTGNGACETVYVTDFEVVNEPNVGWRRLYAASKVVALLSGLGFVVMLFVAPVTKGPR
jgi:hypothetical protein